MEGFCCCCCNTSLHSCRLHPRLRLHPRCRRQILGPQLSRDVVDGRVELGDLVGEVLRERVGWEMGWRYEMRAAGERACNPPFLFVFSVPVSFPRASARRPLGSGATSASCPRTGGRRRSRKTVKMNEENGKVRGWKKRVRFLSLRSLSSPLSLLPGAQTGSPGPRRRRRPK